MFKLVLVVLVALGLTNAYLYCEVEDRRAQDRWLADLRWYAQLDAFEHHSKCLNEQGDILLASLSR